MRKIIRKHYKCCYMESYDDSVACSKREKNKRHCVPNNCTKIHDNTNSNRTHQGHCGNSRDPSARLI